MLCLVDVSSGNRCLRCLHVTVAVHDSGLNVTSLQVKIA